MILMVILILIVSGLSLGSFVNALVWRLHAQGREVHKKSPSRKYLAELSITKGRSMCPKCKHLLSAKDLVPVISWATLKGRCRYCNKPISKQYPLIELATALLFVASYLWWPIALKGTQISVFVLWLMLIVGFMALIVYDLRWLLLPNRIIYPLGFIAGLQALILIASANRPLLTILKTAIATVIGGGIFYLLFQLSEGKWIGGGDVKLGWLLGLIAASPERSILVIFIASVAGTLISLPLMAINQLKRTSTIPFGPFLIVGVIIVQLFGANITHWYQSMVVSF